MSSRLDLAIRIFEKFGAPAFVAASAGGGAPDPKAEAERASEILAKAAQGGAALANLAGAGADGAGDSARLTFGAVVAARLAEICRESGKLPSEADIERINAVFGAVLSFTESYAPAASSGAGRLAILGADGVLDETQIDSMVLHALGPMVGAVSAFSFGRPEKKLAQDVAERLTTRATALVERFSAGGLAAPQKKLSELSALRALTDLFVSCYETETKRLLSLDPAARAALGGGADGALSLDPVWEAFALRAGMLEALAEGLFPAESGTVRAIPSNSLQDGTDSAKQGAVATPPIPATEARAEEKPTSPMGFFKKKKDDQES